MYDLVPCLASDNFMITLISRRPEFASSHRMEIHAKGPRSRYDLRAVSITTIARFQ